MPPRVDLRSFGSIGMIDFSPRQSDQLNVQATREFLAALQSAQPGTPVLELGDRDRLAGLAGHETLDAATIRAIGEKHGIDALVVGELEARRIEPSIRVGLHLDSLSASAEVEGALTVRIYDARSGATLWTRAVRRRDSVAGVTVASGGLSGLGATDPKAAEGRLVRALARQATSDFWPYWVDQ